MCEGLDFTQLYHQHRGRFLNWAKGWTGLPEADIVDAYQDACTVLWQKCDAGTLVLTAQPGTFLFGIGRNILLTRLRGRSRQPDPLLDGMQIGDELLASPEEDLMQQEDLGCLGRIIGMLNDTCATIVRLTFYEEKNSQEIAETAGYASGDVVRQLRRRCMTQLKTLYEKHCK